MHHGRLTEARPAADWTLAAIGLAMAGSAVQEGAHAGLNAHADLPRLLLAAPIGAVLALLVSALLVAWAGAPVGRAYALLLKAASARASR
jgi:hypothetical protein